MPNSKRRDDDEEDDDGDDERAGHGYDTLVLCRYYLSTYLGSSTQYI